MIDLSARLPPHNVCERPDDFICRNAVMQSLGITNTEAFMRLRRSPTAGFPRPVFKRGPKSPDWIRREVDNWKLKAEKVFAEVALLPRAVRDELTIDEISRRLAPLDRPGRR